MKKIGLIVLSAVIIAVGFAGCGKKEDVGDKISIGITQIVEHPSLERIREGIIDGLDRNGFKDGENIDIEYKNAQGDISNTSLIAQSFEKKDYVVAITTPSAQGAFNTLKDVPIIFSGVTDPEGAGLSGENITGVSDMNPVEKQFELIKKLLPDAKKVGIIYNPSEVNSQIQIDMARKEGKRLGMELLEAAIADSSNITSALDSVLDDVDVLYTHKDNMIASVYPLIVKKSNQYHVPIIGAVSDYVNMGALASDGTDDYNVGLETGEMLSEILKGKDVSEMDFKISEKTELVINNEVAEKLGIEIPKELKNSADGK